MLFDMVQPWMGLIIWKNWVTGVLVCLVSVFFCVFSTELLTSPCKNTKFGSLSSSIDFLYDFTLFVIDMHQNRSISLFSRPFVHFKICPLLESNATISRFFVINEFSESTISINFPQISINKFSESTISIDHFRFIMQSLPKGDLARAGWFAISLEIVISIFIYHHHSLLLNHAFYCHFENLDQSLQRWTKWWTRWFLQLTMETEKLTMKSLSVWFRNTKHLTLRMASFSWDF